MANKLSKLSLSFSMLLGLSAQAADLKVGDMAPDFNLQATNGKTYQLSDFKDKQAVVVAWYPMANTSGCTIECLSLIKEGHLIREYDVSYFMASVDPLEDNMEFAEETDADFPMLSDPSKKAAEAYGVLNFLGVAKRWTFYIGKNGQILQIDKDIQPKTAAPDIAKNLAKLKVDKKS
ncbi:redoxin domain-containing protein [Catenovulum sp. SM1970]|uniref:peroxiredoxin family protein n=1 Tax=Marinifaba aquimaris TaxID=2741323 RepID=UPI00157497A7|nr:redoxin domain-containing protein [Marinifaba aquimaris]NTS75522.1 redoxin domain-containing protein [Marinifaba aquimaris]